MLRRKKNGYKSLQKKERLKIMARAFFKAHFKHAHTQDLKECTWTSCLEKVCAFSFFFLIYTKHSLKKPEEGCLLPISSSVAE